MVTLPVSDLYSFSLIYFSALSGSYGPIAGRFKHIMENTILKGRLVVFQQQTNHTQS